MAAQTEQPTLVHGAANGSPPPLALIVPMNESDVTEVTCELSTKSSRSDYWTQGTKKYHSILDYTYG